MIYNVYTIKVFNVIRYVGYTSDLDNRTKQHQRDCFNPGSPNYNKELYKFIRETTSFKSSDINLVSVYTTKNKADAKRYEMYLILQDYFRFDGRVIELKESIPKLTDGW